MFAILRLTCASYSGSQAASHRAYETTYGVTRFNNATNQPFTLAPKAILSLDTGTLAPGVGGSVTVANDGRYGDMTGKATSMDSSAGFSFDTPMVARPH